MRRFLQKILTKIEVMGIFGRGDRLTGAVVLVAASAEFDEDRIELVNHLERRGYFNWLKGNNI